MKKSARQRMLLKSNKNLETTKTVNIKQKIWTGTEAEDKPSMWSDGAAVRKLKTGWKTT